MLTGRMFLSLVVLIGILTQPQSTVALNGQFGLEFAIDAPWRIEPVPQPGGGVSYGPIPITVVFFDANFEKDRGKPAQVGGAVAGNTGAAVGNAINFATGGILGVASGVALNLAGSVWERIGVGDLKGIWVREANQAGNTEWIPIGLHALREIERKGPKSVADKPEPPHQICRPSLGEDCRSLYNIGNAHEWHALFWYTPKYPVKPGQNIHLIVKVVTRHEGTLDTNDLVWVNHLAVHPGEAPLPRFSKDWLYGDLHYHSQMTDNEGESGYAYRNVVRALGAMGLDFVFATDHASNSVQVDGGGEARDLTPSRYLAAKQILYGTGGANDEVARDTQTGGIANFQSRGLLPQVFMGEEVDAKTEMALPEFTTGKIAYGDGLLYPWSNVSGCLSWTREQYCLLNPGGCNQKPLEQFCRERFSTPPGGPRYFTQDNQGIPVIDIQPEPSRQHMVYFPSSGTPDPNGFVPSSTRTYGGASRSVDDLVRAIEANGVTFLAHPLSAPKPGGANGPDIVPYSALGLEQAWGSQAVLGLQFWNENDRYRSPKEEDSVNDWMDWKISGDTHHFIYYLPWIKRERTSVSELGMTEVVEPGDYTFPWGWKRNVGAGGRTLANLVSSELYQGAFTWDAYLRKGLNLELTRRLSWLPAGEPRKWFMAGGSDSHGDWNFRRYGDPCLDRWCGTPVGDTAMGNPRNLLFVGQPIGPPAPGLPDVRRHTNGQVMNTLKNGTFSVTDGPALRIGIDRNRNGLLDDSDFQMGTTFNLFPGEQVPLLLEWMSTEEFGRIKKIDIYLGTKDRTYAPEGHGPPHTVCVGPRAIDTSKFFLRPGGIVEEIKNGKNIQNTCEESSGAYFRQGMGVLRIDLAGLDPNLGYRGTARVYLSPNAPFYLTEQNGKLFYLRAYAQTYGRTEAASGCTVGPLVAGKCGDRHAYTNPIWGRYNASCTLPITPQGVALGRQSIDANGDGFPDTCKPPALPDPCPPPPTSSPTTLPKGGSKLSGVVAPPPAGLAVDPQSPGSGTPAESLRSCKIVVPVRAGAPPGTMAPPTGLIAPPPPPTVIRPVVPGALTPSPITKRGLEESAPSTESQESDVLYIEEPVNAGEHP